VTTGAGCLRESKARRDVPVLELAEWAERYGLTAGITTRDGNFNLGLLTPDPAAEVVARWRQFTAAMAPGFPTIVAGLQIHGRRVATHDSPAPGWTILDGVDGHATRRAGVLCCVTVADCIPVYVAHPPSGAVALLHAGWRGVAGGVVLAGLEAIQALSAADMADVVIHCGVGICGECYEVGCEVKAAVTGEPSTKPGPVDLRASIVRQARQAGVQRISISPWCSAHDAHRFFSHRRSGGVDGRMVAYLGKARAGS